MHAICSPITKAHIRTKGALILSYDDTVAQSISKGENSQNFNTAKVLKLSLKFKLSHSSRHKCVGD